jgi:hypothetical protein
MSATTWPDAALELVWTWHPDSVVTQVPLVVEPPSGGPRAPFAPFTATGPSDPAAEVRAVPAQPEAEPAQARLASAIDHEDAPGTVGPPEFADDPGAMGAGGVAGWS